MSNAAETKKPKYIGFWESPAGTYAGQSEVAAATGSFMNMEADAVLAYIEASTVKAAYKGMASCRACYESLGCCDMLTPDGLFIFPDKYDHYIVDHGVRPPNEFVTAAVTWMNDASISK